MRAWKEGVQLCPLNSSPVGEAAASGASGAGQQNTYICEAAAPGERRDTYFNFVKGEYKKLKIKIQKINDMRRNVKSL